MRPDSAPLVARTKRDFIAIFGILILVCVAIVGAIIYATVHSPPRDDTPLWVVIVVSSAFFILPNLVALWILGRRRVVADESGLQIRGALRMQFIAWRDIEDYELRPSPNAATARQSWIRACGKWRRLPRFLTHTETLCARIQTQATQSRARDWQLSVARDDAGDWPKTYTYRDPNGAKMFGWVAVGLLLIVAIIFVLPGSAANSGGDALEKWLPIAALFLPLLLAHYAVMRARKQQSAPTIRADQSGLTLVDAQKPTRIAWQEITDYFIADPEKGMALSQYVVEGAGERAVFRHDITDFGELQALICARAVNAISSEWKHRENADSDTIGGAQSLWSGDAPGVGRKTYHYRTRTLRALLVLGGFFLLVFVVGYGSSLRWRTPEISDFVAGALFFLPTLVLTVGGALAFWRASIQTDAAGVWQRGIWGERFLRWGEIESFTFNGYLYELKGQRATIRYWLVAAGESLRAEIEARTGLKPRRVGQSDNDE